MRSCFVSDLRDTLGLCFLSPRVTVHAGSLFGSCGKIHCWLFSFGIRSYLFVKLFSLCYIYSLRLVVVAAASQVGLFRDSSFEYVEGTVPQQTCNAYVYGISNQWQCWLMIWLSEQNPSEMQVLRNIQEQTMHGSWDSIMRWSVVSLHNKFLEQLNDHQLVTALWAY